MVRGCGRRMLRAPTRSRLFADAMSARACSGRAIFGFKVPARPARAVCARAARLPAEGCLIGENVRCRGAAGSLCRRARLHLPHSKPCCHSAAPRRRHR